MLQEYCYSDGAKHCGKELKIHLSEIRVKVKQVCRLPRSDSTADSKLGPQGVTGGVSVSATRRVAVHQGVVLKHLQSIAFKYMLLLYIFWISLPVDYSKASVKKMEDRVTCLLRGIKGVRFHTACRVIFIKVIGYYR